MFISTYIFPQDAVFLMFSFKAVVERRFCKQTTAGFFLIVIIQINNLAQFDRRNTIENCQYDKQWTNIYVIHVLSVSVEARAYNRTIE